jgi:hypothetical protein
MVAARNHLGQATGSKWPMVAARNHLGQATGSKWLMVAARNRLGQEIPSNLADERLNCRRGPSPRGKRDNPSLFKSESATFVWFASYSVEGSFGNDMMRACDFTP